MSLLGDTFSSHERDGNGIFCAERMGRKGLPISVVQEVRELAKSLYQSLSGRIGDGLWSKIGLSCSYVIVLSKCYYILFSG